MSDAERAARMRAKLDLMAQMLAELERDYAEHASRLKRGAVAFTPEARAELSRMLTRQDARLRQQRAELAIAEKAYRKLTGAREH